MALGRRSERVEPSAHSATRWIGTLYFAEGLSAAAVATVSVIVFKHLGVGNADIALWTSALVLPWSLKPLWSPLLEICENNRFFVVTTEAIVAIAFAGICAGLAAESRVPICLLLFAFVAVSAATHDIAADGTYVCHLTPDAQTRYIGWLGVAFNAAKLMVQGLMVVIVGVLEARHHARFGWQVAFALLALIMAALAIHHLRRLPASEPRREVPSVRAVVASFWKKQHVAWLVALVLLYRVAEGQLGRIVPLFLLDPRAHGGLGLSTVELGGVYGTFGAAAFMVGAFAGGTMASRLGLGRAIVASCAAFNLPALIYLLLAWREPESRAWVAAAVGLEQLSYGIGAIGLQLVAMEALAPGRYRTAHLAFATGISGLGGALAGMISGRVQSTIGYFGFFGWALTASMAPLFLAWICSRRGYLTGQPEPEAVDQMAPIPVPGMELP